MSLGLMLSTQPSEAHGEVFSKATRRPLCPSPIPGLSISQQSLPSFGTLYGDAHSCSPLDVRSTSSTPDYSEAAQHFLHHENVTMPCLYPNLSAPELTGVLVVA